MNRAKEFHGNLLRTTLSDTIIKRLRQTSLHQNHKTLEDVKELIDKQLKYATLWRLGYLRVLKGELEKLKL